MKFTERDESGCRIYAGAIETRLGVYQASFVVMRVRGLLRPKEICRNDVLPLTFRDSGAALEYAVVRARHALRQVRGSQVHDSARPAGRRQPVESSPCVGMGG